jgi:hypothetical protein
MDDELRGRNSPLRRRQPSAEFAFGCAPTPIPDPSSEKCDSAGRGSTRDEEEQPSDVFPTYSQLFLISIPLAGANGESLIILVALSCARLC